MIDKVKELIHDSNNIVILSGLKMVYECGIEGIRAENKIYETELEYGYSPDEIMTVKFFRNRVELFYDYYKKNVLPLEMHSGPAHDAITKLEQQGKLTSVITRSPYGLHQMAGTHNVIELHGSLHKHICPKCGRSYPIPYIKNYQGVPLCEDCSLILQPELALFGEHLDNGKASYCAELVEKASVLMIAGASTNSYLGGLFLQYYKGDKLIIINDERTKADERANYILQGKCMDILPQLV